jgi:beta-lactamase regulating signal transducer with metallopeptidase domain
MTMIAWMLYTVMVGLCIVAAAMAADWIARLRRMPVRFVWIVAALLSVALPATARMRSRAAVRADRERLVLPDEFIQSSVIAVGRRVPAAATVYTAELWSLAIVLVGLPFIVVYVRFRRLCRSLPETELNGQRVRVSPMIGPVVVGVVRPEIVVPRWVFHHVPDEQRLILAHEAAHIRARDPLVIGGACALVALMPWNPAAWIILSRIRLAIEIDCDARVLREGASPLAYGSLLVDVAERATLLRVAVALSDGSSHLHQRIVAMSANHITHPVRRAAGVALIGLASLFAACEAKMPTSAEIDRMDAKAVEKNAHALGLIMSDSSVRWSVDGVETTAAAATAIAPDKIASVSVSKVDLSGVAHVYVTTKRGEQSRLDAPGVARALRRRSPQRIVGDVDPFDKLATKSDSERPAIFVDGARARAAELKTLDRARISNIEILKGPSAIQKYGSDASRGVIAITMKPAGAP